MDRLLYETHSHTPLCKHAEGEPEEYAEFADLRGLRGLLITCHNPMPNGFSSRVRMSVDDLDEYEEMIQRARESYCDRVDVRMGLEADYFAGYESWVEKQLASREFHYVLGSVHPQIPEFRERYWTDDSLELQRTYFALLGDAAETGLFDSISHPDLIKNLTYKSWNPERIMGDICRTLDRIAASGVAMELNTSGNQKTIQEMNPFPAMLREMARREIPVVIGADAHVPGRVGDQFENALDLLEACGFSEVNHFLDRKRQSVEIKLARQSLQSIDTQICEDNRE